MDLLRFKLTNISEFEFWHFCVLQSLNDIAGDTCSWKGQLEKMRRWKLMKSESSSRS